MSDKDVIFVSLELHEGEIIEIGMIFVNPYTLSEKEKGGTEARFLVKPKNLSTFTDRGPIKMQDLQSAREFKDIQGEIFMKLNDQTWISHQESHSVPQVLTKAFENIGVKAPEAKCILNTHDLLCDAKFDQRTSMSIDGLCKFFGLKKPDRNSAVAFCRMNLEIFKQCLAVVGVEKMIEKTTEKNRQKEEDAKQLAQRKLDREQRAATKKK